MISLTAKVRTCTVHVFTVHVFIYLFIYLFILLDVVNGFGLLVHWSDDPQERLLTFKINGDSSIKTELINKISQMMCTSNCAPSPVSVGTLLRLKHGL